MLDDIEEGRKGRKRIERRMGGKEERKEKERVKQMVKTIEV